MKPREKCSHPCQAPCHPWPARCPDAPCESEMKHYCKCKSRFILTVCMSNKERKPLECNTECWKKQRDQRLTNAFRNTKDYEENKAGIKFEYYPEDAY